MKNRAFRANSVRIALTGAASTSILIVALIFIFLFREAIPFLQNPGVGALLDTQWVPVTFQQPQYGLIPLIAGSVMVTVMATLIAIPFGVIAAVYIAEVAYAYEREILKPFIELLAGIPSVVLGFFGLVVVAPLVSQGLDLRSGLNAFTGALILALMAVPTIISISEDAIRAVPVSYKEASMALGASKLQTVWRITTPSALSGIIAAVMLGMGRVIGETMAVLMVTGNAANLTGNPFDSVRTMTATIASEMGEVAYGSVHYRALFWVGVVLLVMTFFINLVAQRVLRRYQEHE
ncbi:MAG: phosphate ABC transporter permease subunit PstC [Candidatus Hydrogenedentota bacterium]